jgi:hypothetical protein
MKVFESPCMRWALLIALAIEVIPAIELFPAWPLIVSGLAIAENHNSQS